MFALTANEAERATSLREAYEQLATALLRGDEPDPEAVGLLILVSVDAALSGDTTILAGVEQVTGRLSSYLDHPQSGMARLDGQLWTVAQLAGLSRFLLEIESRIARQSPLHRSEL